MTLTSLEPDESGEVYVGYIPLEEQDKVRSGMVAQMNITTYTAYNAIVIPEALIKDGKVKILSAEGVKEVEVKTGVVTENGVEITDGLSRGDKLVLN